MAAVGMEEVGGGRWREMKEVVSAAARMEDEEAVQVVAVTKVEETGKAAEVMVAELTEAAVMAMEAAAMAVAAAAMAMAAAAVAMAMGAAAAWRRGGGRCVCGVCGWCGW